uniref:4_1_CTD domain-containing protein n=1 Tax=Rhabditophanes sp. KR3021 TaxID=114890 RepID=A0AC35TLE9_9BILA
MFLCRKVCFCCYSNGPTKPEDEPPVVPINGNRDIGFTDIGKVERPKDLGTNKIQPVQISSNSVAYDVNADGNGFSEVNLTDTFTPPSGPVKPKGDDTVALTNMMLDDIMEIKEDHTIVPIIHSESEIKIDLNAVEEATPEEINKTLSSEREQSSSIDTERKTSGTSSRVLQILQNDSNEKRIKHIYADSSDEDESVDEIRDVQITREELAKNGYANEGYVNTEDSFVTKLGGEKMMIKKSTMYAGDESEESDTESTDDDLDKTDDEDTFSHPTKIDIKTVITSPGKIEEKKNVVVTRIESITKQSQLDEEPITDDEISEKII